jgi:hypothetical protein
MHSRAVWTCLFLLLISGCTHRQVVSRSAGPQAFAEANRATAGKSAEVLTLSGEVFRWSDVRFRSDSTFGIPVATGIRGIQPSIPTETVATVTLKSRSRGALEGTLIGAVAGAIVGLIAGPDEYCGSGLEICASTTGEAASLGAIGGAFWGAIIGVIRGSRTRIEFR